MKKSSRILSTFLALIMLLSIISAGMVSTSAATKSATIKVESVSALPGSTVEVNVEVKDNPGILGATLQLSYGKGLTLTNATQGEAWDSLVMTKPGKFTSPCKFAWDGQDISAEQIKDGVILTLTFDVAEDVTSSTELPISISYEYGDVADKDFDFVTLDINNGGVTIIDYTPGDVDGNNKVNALDVIYLRRYITGGYDVVINTLAANVNRDSKINTLDAIMIRRFITGGYLDSDGNPLVLYPSSVTHTHNLNHVPAKEATETEKGNIEYWYCDGCGKYFSDSTGKNVITEEDIVIPVIVNDGVKITYHLYDGDTYLEKIGVNNSNPSSYQSSKGLKLNNLKADGYIFDGWYDGEGANGELVKSIPVGSTDEYELYARWTPREYTITFNSPLIAVPTMKYFVNTGATWKNPELNGYNFIGWCDDNNKLVTDIPVGSIGNITLYANWTSKRNQTRPVSHLDDPIIIEDSNKGSILFAYEIGTVENIPISQISDVYQSVGGIKQTYTTQESVTMSESEAKNIAKTVANSTTDSKAWSLSNQWNDVTSVSETYTTQKGWSREEAEQHSKTSSNTYSLNSSTGGSETNTSSSGTSGTVSSSNSSTAGGSVSHERETGSEYEVSSKASLSSEISGQAGIDKVASVGSKVSASLEVSESMSSYEKNKNSVTLNYSKTGTESNSKTANESTANTGVSTWNTTSGYSSSNSVSHTQSVSTVLSEAVSETKGYGQSYSRGGSDSESQSFATSASESNQYSSAVTYSNSTVKTNTKTIELGGDNEGYYRFVLAGRAHVFAVVGYDVSTSSYFTYTYSVMDDDTYTFIDYSKTTANFDDNENGVLPFEVPFFVHKYVTARMLQTDGLIVNQEGVITNYTGTDNVVFIPAYYRMDNRDGTYSSIKITGLAENAFAGKDIAYISLSNFIEEIPDNAFKDCTSLVGIIAPGVKSIGSQAFKGCTKLEKFIIPKEIESLGEKAFDGTNSIVVQASNKDVAQGAINSGAKKIILNISENPEDMNGSEYIVADSVDYFELRGNTKDYSNIKIVSDAKETVINGMNITSDSGVPLKISSKDVVLNRVTINSSGYAALFTNDNVNIGLYGSIKITSANGKAVVCRNTTLSQVDPAISSTLSLSGNLYICGTLSGQELLKIENGSIIPISEEEYAKYIKGSYEVAFDANGGTVSQESKTVFYGSEYGELPTPTKDGFEFLGWYLYDTKITPDMSLSVAEDITLKARWKSDWVLADEAPSTGQIDGDKWTYDLRSTTTSSNTTLDGWTQYDSTWVWGSYGNWSGWSRSSYSSSDSRKVESRTVTDQGAYTSYTYSIYRTPDGYGYGTYGYNTGSHGTCTVYDEITLTYQLSCTNSSLGIYGDYNSSLFSHGYDNKWFYQGSSYHPAVTHVEYRYADRSKVYTYYFEKYDEKESDVEVTASESIKNVNHWVKYIIK